MANTKISALTALTGANLATGDQFAVVDTSAAATKSITVAELKLGIMPAPGPIGATTPSTGAFTTLSATGNIITTAVDAAAQIGVKGTTKGLRIGTNATGARVEGVDTTLMATFQPLTLNGTTVSIDSSSATVGVFSSTGLVVTGTTKTTTGMAVGGATAGAGGLAFPATAVAVADANTLDDYEEGVWTPVFSDGTNNATMSGAAGRQGTYTKIGRKVMVTAYPTVTSLGSCTGPMRITGLPFTVASGLQFTSGGAVSFAAGFALATAGFSITCVAIQASTYLGMYVYSATGGTTAMPASNMTTTSECIVTVTYFV